MDTLHIAWVCALLFCVGALFARRRADFGFGKTISQDNVLLKSIQYGLTGKPDRIVKRWGNYIPEENKPGRILHENYRAQLGVYLVLVEEYYGKRPPYGVVILGNGKRVKVRNTRRLRKCVLDMASKIRAHRLAPIRQIKARVKPAPCRGCGQRGNCEQRLA